MTQLMGHGLPAPIEVVEPHIRHFHSLGVPVKKMVPLLEKHYDRESYSLG